MSTGEAPTDYDVLIVGGGPAGATAALGLTRRGRRVALFERERFPRFHIGESFLPRNMRHLGELGLADRVRSLPHVPKVGAEFVLGDGSVRNDYWFDTALVGSELHETFNIERAPFDAMLLECAREAGATVLEETRVDSVGRLRDGDVALEAGGRAYTGRYLLDASGLFTHLGRQLKTRRVHPRLRKVAFYGHFRNVSRRPGPEGGFPTIVMCAEGWFWLIPIDEERTSVGLVMDESAARTVGVPPREMLFWGIRSSPEMALRCADAVFPEHNGITANFSHACRPYAGPGYFLIGDAATFVDPIFSTGVCLGMMGADTLAVDLDRVLAGTLPARRARRRYSRYVSGSTRPFFRLVEAYYDHAFRELFLQGQGPFALHRAVISVLAGHVFPRPRFSQRWRLALFHLAVKLQAMGVPLADRVPAFSLVAAADGIAAEHRAP